MNFDERPEGEDVTVPDFQSMMLPVLRAVEHGKTYTTSEVNKRVASDLSVTAADLAEMLPSGASKLYYNRVGWSKQHLVKAGLLAQPKRAFYTITGRGKETLAAKSDGITVAYLKQFPEFREFYEPPKQQGSAPAGVTAAALGQAGVASG